MVETQSIKNIAIALGKFQSSCPTINKNTKGYGYKYADLPYIMETITPILKDCDLSFTQLVGGDDGKVSVTTVLIHTKSGESFDTTISANVSANKGGMSEIQAVGSIITYLRRYSLSAILGIVTDEDIDGHVPTPSTKTATKPANKPTGSNNKVKPTLGTNTGGYNKAWLAYRDADSNDKRNSIKQSILNAYADANEVLTKLDEDLKEVLKSK